MQHNERWGELKTRTDILKLPDDGEIALTLVHAPAHVTAKPAVVLIPGMFSNRHFWVSPKGVGLAAALAQAGSPVWLPERRALGRSPKPAKGIRAGLEEHLNIDLPSVQAHIQQHTPGPCVWGGHSFGGVIASRAVAETLNPSLIKGLVLFAAQVEVDKKPLCWPWNLILRGLCRLFGRLPSKRMGLGPEDEPTAAVDDACYWRMNTQRGGDLLQPLKNISCPVLAFSGAADDRDPAAGCEMFIEHMSSPSKRYIFLSKRNGYSTDYDHPGIVVSKSAAKEVWPQVTNWVEEISSSPSTSTSSD